MKNNTENRIEYYSSDEEYAIVNGERIFVKRDKTKYVFCDTENSDKYEIYSKEQRDNQGIVWADWWYIKEK